MEQSLKIKILSPKRKAGGNIRKPSPIASQFIAIPVSIGLLFIWAIVPGVEAKSLLAVPVWDCVSLWRFSRRGIDFLPDTMPHRWFLSM